MKFKILKALSNRNGSTLMEFATVTGLMAVLAVTGMPKLSDIGETAKIKKSRQELDKLGSQALNFYQDKAVKEGRGRFPGQPKYNQKIGGHSTEQDILLDLVGVTQETTDESGNPVSSFTPPSFLQFSGSDGSDWVSVFGTSNNDNPLPTGANLAENVPDAINDWKGLFGDNTLSSPFQDGHYAFQVVAGEGSGSKAIAPSLFIVDLENPSHLFIQIMP